MSSSIQIIEKPDYVTWEDIRQTLVDAHKNNIERGLVVRSTTLTSDQLRDKVADGKCYVALDGNKVVGVAAVKIMNCNKWFCQGQVAHFFFGSVLVDYQGRGIYSLLQKKRYSFVEEKEINIITTNTAAENVRMVKMLPKLGFSRALLFRASDTDHFSIIWVKWLKEKPSIISCRFHYTLSVFKVHFYYSFRRLLNKK